ncbi:hypothetical protein BJ742DRAFT_774332 [Cladochytrium replicatum]|nr:hypothetical protein BJ742DRAFT_774332 [Cladochytrium replicatum]
MRRAYISNFNGSAGLSVITGDAAALWTDGQEWLNKVLSPASTVGIDPTLITVSAACALSDALDASGYKLLTLPNNLIDEVSAGPAVAPWIPPTNPEPLPLPAIHEHISSARKSQGWDHSVIERSSSKLPTYCAP